MGKRHKVRKKERKIQTIGESYNRASVLVLHSKKEPRLHQADSIGIII